MKRQLYVYYCIFPDRHATNGVITTSNLYALLVEVAWGLRLIFTGNATRMFRLTFESYAIDPKDVEREADYHRGVMGTTALMMDQTYRGRRTNQHRTADSGKAATPTKA